MSHPMNGAGPAGLVLAAGASRRMPGVSKLRRRWAETTVLGRVVATAREAGLDPLVVVGTLPCLPDPERLGARVVEVASSGRADSLSAGLAVCPPGPVVVLLGDEPGMRVASIRALCETAATRDLDLARITYRDRPGHPVWIGARARPAAALLTGDDSVWDRLEPRTARVGLVEVDTTSPIDVDSPGALRRARKAAFERNRRS